MKKIYLLLAVLPLLSTIHGQTDNDTALSFVSSDTTLQTSFRWAMKTALHYKGAAGDPVGPWYESALPPRSAFCMRDVSHQSLGAEILGLDRENKNMITLFAQNISAGKDWCSYWEMNKYGKPAPEDYRNDREFWYNLPANFDIMTACWKLYLWTGDRYYIDNPALLHFFEKTATVYLKAWHLEPDSLLTRMLHPNAPVPFDIKDPFHRCRGLASYSEGVPNIRMGVDLVAAIYRGLESYRHILASKGAPAAAGKYHKKALEYLKQIDDHWWDPRDSLYYTYYSGENRFGKTEGETFLLWFDALKHPFRKEKTIQHLLQNKWNVENSSYLPLILYRNGYAKEGYEQIRYLSSPKTERRSYPEVSYGVIEGIVQGLLGVDIDANSRLLRTFYQGPAEDTCILKNLTVLGTRVDIHYLKEHKIVVYNTGAKTVEWMPVFAGHFQQAHLNGVSTPLMGFVKDGKRFSSMKTRIAPGQKATVVLD